MIGCMGVMLAIAGQAAAEDWRIFGAHGTIQIAPKGGAAVVINNDKSLMMKVSEGSTIQVKGKGKLVVVSLKSRQAYEIGDNTTALVNPDVIRALNGSVNAKSGFTPPTGKDGKMGGIVMRSIGNVRSCLNALSLNNTTIVDLTPEIRWENHCRGLNKVNLTILSDDGIVHSAEVLSLSAYRIPVNILKEGTRYLWMVDEGTSFEIASGVFMVSAGKEREEVLKYMKEVHLATTPEDRIAYVYFLSDRGFSDMAKEESNRLRSAFPEASYLSELP
jgi:hypothetical protein